MSIWCVHASYLYAVMVEPPRDDMLGPSQARRGQACVRDRTITKRCFLGTDEINPTKLSATRGMVEMI